MLSVVMLIVVMLSVIMLSVVMLTVIMLSVVVPFRQPNLILKQKDYQDHESLHC
jgi:hypothetical protein